MRGTVCFRLRVSQLSAYLIKDLRQGVLLHTRAGIDYFEAHQPAQICAQLLEPGAELVLVRGYQLSRGGRRRRAQVSGKISDSEIGLMAHRGNDRDCRSANSPRHFLRVESQKIFSRATAATDDQNVNRIVRAACGERLLVMLIDETDRAGNITAGAFALYSRRRKQHVHRSGPARDYIQNITYGGAGRRSNYADATRKNRQWTLQLRGEQPFGFQPVAQLLESA